MLNCGPFIRILILTGEKNYLAPVVQVLKKTLNKIIPKAGTITVNSLFIPSKGDVAGGIWNNGGWSKNFEIFN